MKPKAHRYGSPCSLGALALMTALLSGCTGAPKWGVWSKAPTPAQIATVMGRVEANAASKAAPPEPPKAPVVTVSLP